LGDSFGDSFEEFQWGIPLDSFEGFQLEIPLGDSLKRFNLEFFQEVPSGGSFEVSQFENTVLN